MKISQEEIVAAYNAWRSNAGTQEVVWTAILEAAYTVRKQRKASKRERQRKEKDKQVVESAKNSLMSAQLEVVAAFPMNGYGGDELTPSQAPEWDGKFGLGKWQTRNGGRAVVDYLMSDDDALLGKAYGLHTVIWKMNGSVIDSNSLDPLDLIRPWPKGEQ